MNEGKFWLVLWAIIATATVCLAAIIAVGTVENNKIAFENGYESVTLPGTSGGYWQKVK